MRSYFLATLMIFSTASAHAAGGEGFPWNYAARKAEVKQATKWSLGEWMAAKNQMKLMDMWLAMHTPTPYEFYLGVDYRAATFAGSPHIGGLRYSMGAYTKIFGVVGERDNLEDRWEGTFNVRLWGYQQQGSHLTVGGGFRADGTPQATNPVFRGELDLYFMQTFGFEVAYRRDFGSFTSSRWTGGMHLDFAFLRLIGEYWSLSRDTGESLHGWSGGARVYF